MKCHPILLAIIFSFICTFADSFLIQSFAIKDDTVFVILKFTGDLLMSKDGCKTWNYQNTIGNAFSIEVCDSNIFIAQGIPYDQTVQLSSDNGNTFSIIYKSKSDVFMAFDEDIHSIQTLTLPSFKNVPHYYWGHQKRQYSPSEGGYFGLSVYADTKCIDVFQLHAYPYVEITSYCNIGDVIFYSFIIPMTIEVANIGKTVYGTNDSLKISNPIAKYSESVGYFTDLNDRLQLFAIDSLLFAFSVRDSVLYLSRDLAQHWEIYDTSGFIITLNEVKKCFSGIIGCNGAGIFYSNDTLKTWNKISDKPVYSIRLHDFTLYAATYVGSILISRDSGKTWNEELITEDITNKHTFNPCFPKIGKLKIQIANQHIRVILPFSTMRRQLTISLYTITGKRLYSSKVMPDSDILNISVSELSNDIYILSIADGNNSASSSPFVLTK